MAALKIDVVTIFPGIFPGPLGESVVGRALAAGLAELNVVDLRGFATDARRTVDERPYGGGPGMLMTPEPLCAAVESLRRPDSLVVLTSPRGEVFNQAMAWDLSRREHLVFICGHYEGVDERVVDSVVDREISIGDYVLSNGNLPTMVMIDAVVRLLPGALGCPESAAGESFSDGTLEFPQYTRPAEFRGMRVPEVLLSGDHGAIAEWRRREALEKTRRRRPDLLGCDEDVFPKDCV